MKPAGQPPSIIGRVDAAGGGTVRQATLTLLDLEGRVVGRGDADSTGQYGLTPPGQGTYVLNCMAEGYQPQAALVAIADRTVRHDITLE